MKTNGEGQAFAGGANGSSGLTKREYMATAIMAGFIASSYVSGNAAHEAVRYADSLINALNGEVQKEPERTEPRVFIDTSGTEQKM